MSLHSARRKNVAFWLHSLAAAIQAGMLITLGTSAWAGGTEPQPFTVPRPRLILVKVKAPLAKDLESALPDQGREVAHASLRSPEAHAFLTKYSPKKLSPLHPGLIHQRRKTGWSDAQLAEHLRQAFPKRTGHLSRSHATPEVSRTYVLEVEEGASESVESIIARLKLDPDVEYAEPNHVVTSTDLPNDPFLASSGSWGQAYQDLWGLWAIKAPAAWATSTGSGKVVAVIDTGVDFMHPDIAGNMWANTREIAGNGIDDDGNGYVDDDRGWDFIAQGNTPLDSHGHGTHVAGTIAATGNNGSGVIGVAYNAKIMNLKGLDASGNGTDASLVPAIIYAAKNGADVINASFSGLGSDQTMEEAIQFAYSVGVVFVAAAGNNGVDAWGVFPANSPEAITVAASPPPNANMNWVSWSNYGTKVDVAAPGVSILSLQASGTNLGPVVASGYPNYAQGYVRLDGTSMAAPHVSGLAALLLSQRPDFPIESLRQTLRASANINGLGFYPLQGAGLVDATAALAFTDALQAHFTSPAGQTHVNGPITLAGIAQGTGFHHYVLEYGPGISPVSWTQFAYRSSAVANGTLGTFDPGYLLLPDGTYVIRLTAFNASGQAFSDRLQLEVSYITITGPPNPPVPVLAQVWKPGAQMAISGSAAGPSFQSFRIEWAKGIYPGIGWTAAGMTLAGSGAAPITNGTLGIWNTAAITQADYYTIRVSVVNSGYTSSASTLVYLEPDLLSQNWPRALSQSSSFHRGLVPVKSAGGDTTLALVAPVTAFFPTGQFLRFTPDGSLQSSLGFAGGGNNNNPCAGDVTGTGSEDVVFTSDSNHLISYRRDNSHLALLPKPADGSINYWTGTPVMANLEGAEAPLDIVAVGCDRSTGTASLYAWRGDGSTPFPHLPGSIPDEHRDIRYGVDGVPRVLVGDVDGDGFKEFVIAEGLSSTTYTLGLFALDGASIPWAVPVFTGRPTALALADLDHNGKLETVMIDSGNVVHVFQPDGQERPGWPQAIDNGTVGFAFAAAIGDLAHTGHEQIVVTTGLRIYIFNADGTTYSSAWPLLMTETLRSAAILADIDGDGIQEIILPQRNRLKWLPNPRLYSASDRPPDLVPGAGSLRTQGNGSDERLTQAFSAGTSPSMFEGSYYWSPSVVAYRPDGSIARSWNMLGAAGNQPVIDGAIIAVGDFKKEGFAEIAVTYPTMEGGDVSGWLNQGVATVLRAGGAFHASLNDWPMTYRDAQNSSVLARVQVEPPAPALAGFAPATASVGSPVTLTGTALRFATYVKFNGIPASFNVASDTSITATVPPGALSGRITVTTPGGTSTSSASLTVASTPAIDSFSPAVGRIGASVTLTGSRFTGATTVRFNGTSASFSVDSDTSITTTVPAGSTTGRISVTTPGGTASSSADFTVNAPPSITTQPASLTRAVGDAAAFAVAATGSGTLSYQWLKGGTNINGATSATCSTNSVQASDAGIYACVVTNSLNGTTASTTSSSATLTVNAGPTLTTQPASQTLPENGTATFTVAATGSGTLSYQWTKGGTTIAGATSATYSKAGVQASDAGIYACVVTNTLGGTTAGATSNPVTLTVIAAPVITTQPASQTLTLGGTATFTLAATGSGTLAFQWTKDGSTIVGATSAIHTIASVQVPDEGIYACVVTNTLGGTAASTTSASAVLTVNAGPTLTTQPASQTLLVNGTATFTVAATGSGTLSYQWTKGGTAIAGATSAIYSIASVQASDEGIFACVVTNTLGGTTAHATSSPATLTINAPPVITTQPTSQTLALGGTATFTLAATGSGTLAYQWTKDGSTVVGATSAIYSIASVQASDEGIYACVVTNTLGGTAASTTSGGAVLTVNAGPVLTTQPASQTLLVNGTATFTVAATGSGALSYQWTKGGTTIAGATSATYSNASVQPSDAGIYACVVTNTLGGTTARTTSSPATLTVNTPPGITTQPSSQTMTLGGTATFTLAATGSGTLTYQWTKDGSTIAGATSTTYSIASVQVSDAGIYACAVTNTLGGTSASTTSGSAVLTFNAGPALTTQPVSRTSAVGGAATFTVEATGSGTLSYQWLKNGTEIRGGTSATFSIASVQFPDAGIYACIVTNSLNGTTAATTSSSATLTVLAAPVITVTVIPKTATVVTNGQVILWAGVTGTANPGVTWSITSGEGTLSAGAPGSITFTATGSTGTTTITAVSQADGTKSDNATVTVRTRDLTGDGLIDVLDLAFLARAWGSTPGSPNWNAAADLNGDGNVDETELALFLAGL